MISTSIVALLLVALTFFPQDPQSCNGDCQAGYRSVCVQRGPVCKCSCIKDVATGVTALRDLLYASNVSDLTITEAEKRYSDLASQESGEFSFTVYDSHTGQDLIIRGKGFAGKSPDTVCCLGAASEGTRGGASTSGRNRFVTSVKALK